MNIAQSERVGDHLFDPSEVPGVIFISNSKYQPFDKAQGEIANMKNPNIEDIMPTVLKILGIKNVV